MGHDGTLLGAERGDQQGLRLLPATRRAQHRAVRHAAVGVHHDRARRHRLVPGADQVGPLSGALDVAGAVARGQHRAEADPGGRRRDLAGDDRGQRGVEPGEAVANPTPGDERQALVAQRSRLEVGVALLDGEGERTLGGREQVVGVEALARQDRQLEVAPLQARADHLELAARPLQPAVAGRGVAEHPDVRRGELHRGAGGEPVFARLAEEAERGLPRRDRLGVPLVHEPQATQQEVGRAVARRGSRLRQTDRLVEVPLRQRGAGRTGQLVALLHGSAGYPCRRAAGRGNRGCGRR